MNSDPSRPPSPFEGIPVTLAIAGVTVLCGLALIVTGDLDWAAVVGGFIPLRVGTELSFPMGYAPLPQWITPLTATLIHGGFFHLTFNMVMLLFAGGASERALGARGVVVLYLVGAYVACAAQWLVEPSSDVAMVGASGAISACIGAYALLYGRVQAKPVGPIPARVVQVIWLLVAWSVINLLIGYVSGGAIAAAAHVGGFIVGLALARPLLALRWRSA